MSVARPSGPEAHISGLGPVWSFPLACVLALSMAGCASEPCRTGAGTSPITPTQAAQTNALGAQVRWGGVVIQTRNLADTTEVTAMAHRLDGCGRPDPGAAPLGRFVLRYPGFLDPAEYTAGRALTATGAIVAVRPERMGTATHPVPVVQSYHATLWPRAEAPGYGFSRPAISIGIGGGSGGVHGGVGVHL